MLTLCQNTQDASDEAQFWESTSLFVPCFISSLQHERNVRGLSLSTGEILERAANCQSAVHYSQRSLHQTGGVFICFVFYSIGVPVVSRATRPPSPAINQCSDQCQTPLPRDVPPPHGKCHPAAAKYIYTLAFRAKSPVFLFLSVVLHWTWSGMFLQQFPRPQAFHFLGGGMCQHFPGSLDHRPCMNDGKFLDPAKRTLLFL